MDCIMQISRIDALKRVTVMKFGGSALGVDGSGVASVIERIIQKMSESKIVAVFSAPLTHYNGRTISMTDVAIHVGKSYSNSNPVEIDILKEVYENISSGQVSEALCKPLFHDLSKFHKEVIVSLKQAAENRRFVDVTRARTLAYSGEIAMSYLMDYILRSKGLLSTHVRIENWPIITDDNFEAATFLFEESMKRTTNLKDLIEKHDIVTIGGFVGKTVDGLETTYERGGSDRTAADLALLLTEEFETELDFEKDNVVFSADPKIVKQNLEYVKELSYNEARLAGMFGMKILDPLAIKEIDDNGLDIPITISDMKNPAKVTRIMKHAAIEESKNYLKIVTGKKNCAIVRIESIAASHLVAMLESDKQYHDFVKLSPYKKDGIEITRLLFLDGDYVRRQERHFKAFYPKLELVYGRGVVTLIGDNMWKIPGIASTTSSTVGEHKINILNMDAQEETSRILIVVDESNVSDAVRAVHAKRNEIHGVK
jgi:aspartate kinase